MASPAKRWKPRVAFLSTGKNFAPSKVVIEYPNCEPIGEPESSSLSDELMPRRGLKTSSRVSSCNPSVMACRLYVAPLDVLAIEGALMPSVLPFSSVPKGWLVVGELRICSVPAR